MVILKLETWEVSNWIDRFDRISVKGDAHRRRTSDCKPIH